MSARGFPLLEVGKHRAPGDAWVVVDNRILDVSAFAPQHPGGADILLACAGGDVTREFLDVGHSSDARQRLTSLEIGGG
jgi:cytochrome b5